MKHFFDPLPTDISCQLKNEVSVFSHYHYHDGIELFLLLNGEVNYYIDEHCYHLSRGSLILINPEEYHRSELLNHETYERIVINVSSSLLATLSTKRTSLTICFEDRPFCEGNLIELEKGDLQELIVLSRHLASALAEPGYGYDLLALSFLLQILVKANLLYQSDSRPGLASDIMPSLVRDTMNYIEEHLTESFCLADLSKAFYHNGSYISRCFKRVTGLTIQQYTLYKRIGLAQKYLQEGYPLTDVCWMAGFNNYSNFSRSFTQYVGYSPKKYQSAHIPPPEKK